MKAILKNGIILEGNISNIKEIINIKETLITNHECNINKKGKHYTKEELQGIYADHLSGLSISKISKQYKRSRHGIQSVLSAINCKKEYILKRMA